MKWFKYRTAWARPSNLANSEWVASNRHPIIETQNAQTYLKSSRSRAEDWVCSGCRLPFEEDDSAVTESFRVWFNLPAASLARAGSWELETWETCLLTRNLSYKASNSSLSGSSLEAPTWNTHGNFSSDVQHTRRGKSCINSIKTFSWSNNASWGAQTNRLANCCLSYSFLKEWLATCKDITEQ